MDFQVKVLGISFIITLIISVIVIPLLRRLKIGQIERDDGPRSHLKKQGTPTMGGIIMMLTSIIVCIGVYFYYRTKEPDVANHLLPMLLLTLGFGLIGLIDDFKKLVLKNTKGLSPTAKMVGLLVISVAYTLYLTNILHIGTDIYIPFAKIYISLPIWLYVPLAILVMLSTTNAINLTDGIDGLSSSVTTIILTALTVIAIVFDVKEATIFGSMLAGTCLGFLVFNLYPAKVMMGDTGSLMLGGAVAAIAIMLKMPLYLIIVAFVCVFDTISVILQVAYFKITHGKRIFKMAPFHHHLELSGMKESNVVILFWIITAILCLVAYFI